MKLGEAMRAGAHDEVLALLDAGEGDGDARQSARAIALLKSGRGVEALEAIRGGDALLANALFLCGKYAEALSAVGDASEGNVLRAQCLARLDRFGESLREFLAAMRAGAAPRAVLLDECAAVLALHIKAEGAIDETSREALGELRANVAALGDGLNAVYALAAAAEVERSDELRDEAIALLSAQTGAAPPNGDWSLADERALALLCLRTRLCAPYYCSATEFDGLKALLTSTNGRAFDSQLRLALLSAMLRFLLANERADESVELLGEIDETFRRLPRGGNANRALKAQIGALRATAFLALGRVAEARRAAHGEALGDGAALGLELELAICQRNPRELQQRLAPLLSAPTLREKCIAAVVQLAYASKMNFQKKYAELLLTFAREFLVEQLKLAREARFLPPNAFDAFARSTIAHILRCAPLLRALRDEFALLAQFLDEPALAAQVAEGCAAKGDFETARRVYEALLARQPDNALLASRLNVIYAAVAPERIDAAVLPQFELITDANALRELEHDYQRLLRAEGAESAALVERRRRRARRRIRWPKGFDFAAPGPRPDPERWLPKRERARFRRHAAKKGIASRTQGAANVSKQSAELFAAAHSTAGKATVSAASKRPR